MRPLSSTEARQYTHPLLTRTFIQRVEKILNSDIDDLLPDNPYLLPAASPTWAATFVEDALGDHLRQAEVTFIDDLLRALFDLRRRTNM